MRTPPGSGVRTSGQRIVLTCPGVCSSAKLRERFSSSCHKTTTCKSLVGPYLSLSLVNYGPLLWKEPLKFWSWSYSEWRNSSHFWFPLYIILCEYLESIVKMSHFKSRNRTYRRCLLYQATPTPLCYAVVVVGLCIQILTLSSPVMSNGYTRKRSRPYRYNPPFLIFDILSLCCGAQKWAPQQSDRMSKIKNGGLYLG